LSLFPSPLSHHYLSNFNNQKQNVAAGKGHGAAGEAATTYVAAPVTYVAAPVKPPKVHKAPKQVVYGEFLTFFSVG